MVRGKLLVALIAALAAGTMYLGVTTYSPPRITPNDSEHTSSEREEHHVSPHHDIKPPDRQYEEVIYLGYNTSNDILLTPVRVQVRTPSPRHALLSLLRYRLSPHEEDIGLVSPIPPGVHLLGIELSPDGTATANFSRELQTNFGGGSRSEQVMVYSIVNTLAQFPQVKRVRVLVEGQIIESLGGHVAVNEPLEPDYSIVAQLRGQE
ncbi:MAG: GerMN domain-containing protein [Armatimonadota bacterium]